MFLAVQKQPCQTITNHHSFSNFDAAKYRKITSPIKHILFIKLSKLRLTSFFSTSSSGSEFMGSSALENPSFSSEASTERDALFHAKEGEERGKEGTDEPVNNKT